LLFAPRASGLWWVQVSVIVICWIDFKKNGAH
jgi:hypothetical protein